MNIGETFRLAWCLNTVTSVLRKAASAWPVNRHRRPNFALSALTVRTSSACLEVSSVIHQRLSRHLLFLGLIVALAAPALSLSAARAPRAGAQSAASAATVSDLVSAESGLSFTLNTPPATVSAEGEVAIAGLEARVAQPGAPAIPYYTTLVALPPGAQATLVVSARNVSAHSLTAPLAAAPQVADQAGLAEALDTGLAAPQLEAYGVSREKDTAIYSADSLYPGVLYDLSEPMQMRDLRVVRLSLYPMRYNPVRAQLQLTGQLDVTLRFLGATPVNPANTGQPETPLTQALGQLVLNADQARDWRSRPAAIQSSQTAFPLGVQTFKIEVNQDGIYEVTYADLVQAGMNVNGVNPHNFALNYRGQSMSYQFLGDADNAFEPGEALRFYGWAFDSSRMEEQFISNNVYWLWLDAGAASLIPNGTNISGSTNIDRTRYTVNDDPNVLYYGSFTDQWQDAPNEPDSWYWARMQQITGCNYISPCQTPFIQTAQVDLPHPVLNSSSPANITVEVMGRGVTDHNVRVDVNGVIGVATLQFYGKLDANAVGTLAAGNLIDGANTFDVVLQSDTSDYIYLNRIEVEYSRYLMADNNQFIFPVSGSGARNLLIGGFSQNNPANAIVWNITDRNHPVRIPLTADDISGSGPYQYRVGLNYNGLSHIIATTEDNVLSPQAISKYVGASLEPAGGSADWIAISHASLLASANTLATYRHNKDGMATHVINVEDVVNQYGYGLWLPSAIHDYLYHATMDWDTPPTYVLLVGDSTINPRQLPTVLPPGNTTPWDTSVPQLVPTGLEFVDRSQGQIPTDHVYAMLLGDDELPDIAVGRLPAKTPAEADAMVQKIIRYETAFVDEESWTTHLLFVADDSDSGGAFCYENQTIIDGHVPADYVTDELCLPVGYSQADLDALRANLFTSVNAGIGILNYRGHGSIPVWSNIMSINDTAAWFNDAYPTFILSADCLDGYFAWPGWPALGETYFKLTGTGSAGHWSSSGLGFTDEHTVLHQAFYDGLHVAGLTTSGEAAVYSKIIYLATGNHRSEAYAFILLGDPAMQMAFPKPPVFVPYTVYLPTIVKQTTIGK